MNAINEALSAAGVLIFLTAATAYAQDNATSPTAQITSIESSPLVEVPFLGGEPINLTLRDAVLATLAHNLDIRITEIDRDASAEDVWGAYGIYDPVAAASVARVRVDQQQGILSPEGGQQVTYTDATETEASLTQRTPLGTTISIFGRDARTRDHDPFVFGFDAGTVNPSYNSTIGARVTQPLLKNFGPLVNNAEIRIAKRELDISNLQYRESIQNRLSDVMTAYWNLDFTLRNLVVQRQALVSAEELLRVNARRFDVGDLPYLDVAQAQAQVASRDFLEAEAEELVAQAQDLLMALMNWKGGAENPAAWDHPIRPISEPNYNPYVQINDEKLLDIALTNRPEHLQNHVQLEIAQINRDVTKRQRLPELNAFAGYNLTGLEDQRSQSYETTLDNDYTGYSYGIEFRYPLFNRRARADYHIAEDRLEQAQLRIENSELLILQQVRAATRSYRTALKQIESANRQVAADEEKVRAEQRRLEVGQGTVLDVLEFQDDLALSRANRFRALANYQIALIEIARSSGTLLDIQGIRIDEQQPPGGWDVFAFEPNDNPKNVHNEQTWSEMLRALKTTPSIE